MTSLLLAARASRRLAMRASALCGALALAWLSVHVNMKRSCQVDDTPYFDLCPGAPAVETLRERVARNPGDTPAFVQLAGQSTAERAAVLTAMQDVAPRSPAVLSLAANDAIARKDWAAAAPALAELVQIAGSPGAAQGMARIAASADSAVLVPLLQPESRWLGPVLAQMQQMQLPLAGAIPLISRALQDRLIEPAAVRDIIRQLKAKGAWADAYGLWVLLHGPQVPVLYNGHFDTPFEDGGFDWIRPDTRRGARAGVVVEQSAFENRGQVLDLRFAAHPMRMPLVVQTLFVAAGRYRLRGEYRAAQLRLDRGLAWVVRCGADRVEVGRIGGLNNTNGGSWQRFAGEITIPATCGLVADLQLETDAAFEAAVGTPGRVAFDSLQLERVR
jgi:hypothetical protein